MKTSVVVQTLGNEKEIAEVEKKVKEELKAQGIKVTTVETLNIYLKPIENECYFVASLKDGSEIEGQIENC